ncbi:MAG: hypothetical protein MUE85_22520 [Microscillaceae bacterium]|jgi:hypothetical protein|nr:hypothetical protein [Microscillaceae bacterium]
MKKDAVFQLRFDNETFEKAKIVAEKKGLSLAGMTRNLLIEKINEYEKEFGKIELPETALAENS